MDKALKLYNSKGAFPSAENQIEILGFNYNAKRMGGAPIITATVMYGSCLDKTWTDDVHVIFNGEKYYLKQTPTSSFSNADARYKHDCEFVSERIKLDNVYFFDAVVDNTPVDDKPVTNNTKVVFSGDIHEFVKRLNASLKYTKLDYSVVVDEGITSETKFLDFADQPISSVLQEIYKQYEIPYYFDKKVIHIGFTSNAITETFKYGINDALLSISKNNANNKIVNRCMGVGSSENIPYYYPNEHPLGIVDTYFTPNGGTKTLNNNLVTNKPLFAEKVKNGTELKYITKTITTIEPSFYLFEKDSYENYEDSGSIPHNRAVTTFLNGWTRNCMVNEDFWYLSPMVTRSDCYAYDEHIKNRDLQGMLFLVYKKFNPSTQSLYIRGEARPKGDSCVYFKVDRKKYSGRTLSLNIEINHELIWHYVLSSYNSGLGETIEVDKLKDDYVFILFYHEEDIRTTFEKVNISISLDKPLYDSNWYNENGAIVQLKDYGLTYNGTPSAGDKITFQTRENSLIPFQDTLMPPIYTESKGTESFYNAYNNTYISPETGTYYEFENVYSDENRREHKETFDYIKPSIEFVRNGEETPMPINMFLAFAYDDKDNDEIDESGEYVHPYFYAKLRKFNGKNGFNLFDYANEKGEMTISMTSGNCGACQFVIGVDENTKKNIVQVDNNGNLVYENGKVKLGDAQDRQNDTVNNEVWIALKKDNQTFGTLLPNKSIKPKACSYPNSEDGDTFVITNISLPTAYIQNAEERLKEEIIKYMKLNNSEKFTFSIKFSRIFLAENPNVFSQINENARIQIEYNEVPYELYVSSYQYKVLANESLPEITVELVDTLSTNENAIQKAISAVEYSIMSSVGSIDFYKQGLRYFLRKDVDDCANGLIHLQRGATFGADDIAKIDENGNAEVVSQVVRQFITTPQFIDGFTGEGFKLWLDNNGKSNLTIDNLTARETFRVFELLVTKLRAVNGGLFVSAANGTIKNVLETEDGLYYDIILENENTFIAGDYMRCEVMNGRQQTSYWVEVYSVNERTCRVLKSEFNGATPIAGQDVVLDGSKNIGRQNAIHISATDDGKPRIDILNGISTKSHDGCLRTRLGDLRDTEDSAFGAGVIKGDGLYSDNAYLKGEFILKDTGENIATKFAITEEGIKSTVEQTQAEAIKGKTLLYNASFIKGLDGWLTSNEDSTYFSGTSMLFASGSMLAQSVSVSNEPIYDNVFFVNIKNGWIKQSNINFINKPEFANDKEYPLSFSTNIRCNESGILNVYLTNIEASKANTFIGYSDDEYVDSDYIFVNLANNTTYLLQLSEFGSISQGDKIAVKVGKEPRLFNLTQGYEIPIIEWRDEQYGLGSVELTEPCNFICTKFVAEGGDFQPIYVSGLHWNGEGSFYLEFSGDADLYGLVLYTSDTEVRHKTLFEQTDRLVGFSANQLNTDGSIRQGAEVVATSDGAQINVIYTDNKNKRVKKTLGDFAIIDGEATKVTLSGDNIQLKGDLTVDGKVSIDEKGRLHAKDGIFEGRVVSKEGSLSGWEMKDSTFSKYNDPENKTKGGAILHPTGLSIYGLMGGARLNTPINIDVPYNESLLEGIYINVPTGKPAINVNNGDIIIGGKKLVEKKFADGKTYLSLEEIV